jgi:thioester reductase-like protein
MSQDNSRHYFVTGATGTVGSAVVERILREPDTRVSILVRADNEAALEDRRQHLLAHWGVAADSTAARRLQALSGDILKPKLGLAPGPWSEVVNDATHIVHCAASVKLNMAMDLARATAVTPTAAVLDLSRQARQGGRLQKVEIVSTVGVWGRTPGVLPERPVPEVNSFHNTYEAAKAEAEKLIWALEGQFPVTVHRPSMVVGRRGDGQVMSFQVFYHLCEFLSGVRTRGIMPTLGHTRLDTVPVDWVAEAIHWSSRQPSTAGAVLHLCSGPGHATPLTDLQDRVRRLWQAHGVPLPGLKRVNLRVLSAAVPVLGLLGGPGARRALRALPPVLAYLAEDQGFSNDRSCDWLAQAGLALPPPPTYLDAVLVRYLRERRSSSSGG